MTEPAGQAGQHEPRSAVVVDEPETVEAPAPLAPTTAVRARRRRRPTGAPPALPKSIGTSGQVWLAGLVLLLIWMVAATASSGVLRATDHVDTGILRALARLRTGWLTDVMDAIDRVGSGWTLTVVALGTIALNLVFRRWRHLIALLASVAALEVIGGSLYDLFSRPRPYGVTTIGRWSGFAMPSPPVAVLSAVLMAVLYTMVVPGRPRSIGKWVAGVVLGLFVLARLYLGTDHPSDAIVAVVFGVVFPLLAFRLFTPNDVFPVKYRQGKTAHLDVTGRRGEAIRAAVQDQLGLTVLEAKPVGLEGSGGSTPLRLRVAGDPDTYVFAKLYAMSHVRADRWYKLGRTILYGRLEDEAPFQNVRRLVEYEDYTLRLLRDVGIPTATPYGIVEITPEREYILVTEFFDGALEIGEAEVDDDIIDEALMLIRQLWDAGLAHRDIKPANLLVQNGHVLLIDVFFVQVRPSPWRQAVDLANMMLVLAVRTDAHRVCQRALRLFTPDEIAEAFAATRGVASPTQLRTMMKQDGRNLVEEFRSFLPERRPIGLQRWSVRRVVLVAACVLGVFFAVNLVTDMLSPAHDLPLAGSPDCGTSDVMILVAQSVPSATSVPCIATLPAGWDLDEVDVRHNQSRFWLNSDRAGQRAVQVTLQPLEDCDVTGADIVPSDEVGAQRYERPERLPPSLRSTRYYLFDGGCVTYRFAFDKEATASLMFDADQALAFQPRGTLVEKVRETSGLALCGVGEVCPGGDGT